MHIGRADFEAMPAAFDLRFYSRSADALTHRELEILSAREVAEALEAPSPLAFWRAKQGVSQKALSDAAGFSQGYIADLEVGSREGDLAITKQLGRALRFEWKRRWPSAFVEVIECQ